MNISENIFEEYRKIIRDSNDNIAEIEKLSSDLKIKDSTSIDDSKDAIKLEWFKHFSIIIGFCAAFTGLIVTSIHYINTIRDYKILFAEYIVIAIIVLTIISIFSMFYLLFLRKISKKLTNNYLGYDKVTKKYVEMCRLLARQSAVNFMVTENIQRAPVSHLISWRHSADIECRSRMVWAISYTLKWLDRERIKTIAEELKEKPSDEYRFIYIGKKTEICKSILVDFYCFVDSFDISDESLKNRFQIRVYNGDNLPIPNDICLYKGFEEGNNKDKQIVVINTKEFDGANGNNPEMNFDLRFDNDESCQRIIDWFNKTWPECTKIDV